LINELIERFSLTGKKEITFQTAIDLPDAFVWLDATLIENALANLIDNAIKYSKEKVTITIKCFIENKWLYISVKDNGFGIAPKDRNRIFEKYERGEAAFRKGATGFGLGLNYVKSVVESHGGNITLKSVVGEGSEFILQIPSRS